MKIVFKRQKLALSLLEIFENKLSKINFQKYMFLYIKEFSKINHYEFIPYQYGSFSYELYKDLNTFEKNSLITIKENYIILNQKGFVDNIDEKDKLFDFYTKYKDIKNKELIKIVYTKYPYYAINSKIAKEFISKDILKQYTPYKNITALYTIGYESKKFEGYLNQLIKNDIKVLVDVRKNAFSMKYGFSKKTLKNAVENLGIKYIHLPNLGIESKNRKTLNSTKDYNKLFKIYEEMLFYKQNELMILNDLIQKEKRVAITCFEKDVKYCHRGVIANYMKNNFNIEVINL